MWRAVAVALAINATLKQRKCFVVKKEHTDRKSQLIFEGVFYYYFYASQSLSSVEMDQKSAHQRRSFRRSAYAGKRPMRPFPVDPD